MGSYMSSQAGSQIQYPKSSKEVTKEWLQQVLQQHHQKTNPTSQLTVKSFQLAAASGAGDNFNGVLMRIQVKILFGDSSEQHRSYVIKFLSNNPVQGQFCIKFNQHKKENFIYSQIIKDFQEFQKEHYTLKYHIGVPDLICGVADDYDFLLMMEDLTMSGYEVNPKEEGLSFEKAKIAIQQLATLHALSYSFNKKTDFIQKYPVFEIDTSFLSLYLASGRVMFENVIQYVATQNDYKNTKEKLDKILIMFDQVIKLLTDKTSCRMQCLLHGDYWNNNLLFHKDLSHKDEHSSLIRLIDWQMAYWGNPMHDLQYVIYSSLTKEVRESHLEDLLISYYTVFNDITTHHQCNVPEWSFHQFMEEFEEYNIVGFVLGIMVQQCSLSKFIKNNNDFSPDTSYGYGMHLMSKAFVYLSDSFLMKMLVRQAMKKQFGKIAEEMLLNDNKVLTDRTLELVTDMENQQTFDKFIEKYCD